MNQTTFQVSNASAQGRGWETNPSKNDPQPSHFGTQYPDSVWTICPQQIWNPGWWVSFSQKCGLTIAF